MIPSHARQLVLELGQTQQEGTNGDYNLKLSLLKIDTTVTQSLHTDDALADKGSAKKYSAPPEYLEKRKQERERRRSETGIRQKFKKGGRKSDTAIEVRSDEDIIVRLSYVSLAKIVPSFDRCAFRVRPHHRVRTTTKITSLTTLESKPLTGLQMRELRKLR